MHFELLHTSHRTRKPDPIFDSVDRILRQQKEAREEARAAAEFNVKKNQNIDQTLHPLGVGVKQLPDSDSHSISLQHEPSQATDKLDSIPNSLTSDGNNTLQNLKRAMSSLGSTPLERLTALGRGLAGSSPPQVPPSLGASENLIEPKLSTISSLPSPARSSNPAVTPLSHICASPLYSD